MILETGAHQLHCAKIPLIRYNTMFKRPLECSKIVFFVIPIPLCFCNPGKFMSLFEHWLLYI